MGNDFVKARQRRPIEEKTVAGLLPIANINAQNFDIHNLVFAGGCAESSSYAGAISVLEKLGLMPKVKRFAGVGTGAIVATLLALGLDSNELQKAFNEHLDNMLADDEFGYENLLENLKQNYGWNTGTKFLEWFVQLLESKGFDSELSLLQLYEKTGNELCLVVINVDLLALEYYHPKITPHLTIKRAVFMALSIPGIFAPTKYGDTEETSLHLNASLMCTYPIECFDGWLLSMADEDCFLNKLECPNDFFSTEKSLGTKNKRTLGFFRFDKNQENACQSFIKRLTDANANIKVPNTTLGQKYKQHCQTRITLNNKFSLLRKICTVFISMAEGIEDEEGTIPIDSLAQKLFTDKSLSKTDCQHLFPQFGRSLSDLKAFLSSISNTDTTLTRRCLNLFFQTKTLELLDRYSDLLKTTPKNLQTYFTTMYDALQNTAMNFSQSDYDRSVGIFTAHVYSRHLDLDDDDQSFLYRQGWNATVAFLRQANKNAAEAQTVSVNSTDCLN